MTSGLLRCFVKTKLNKIEFINMYGLIDLIICLSVGRNSISLQCFKYWYYLKVPLCTKLWIWVTEGVLLLLLQIHCWYWVQANNQPIKCQKSDVSTHDIYKLTPTYQIKVTSVCPHRFAVVTWQWIMAADKGAWDRKWPFKVIPAK